MKALKLSMGVLFALVLVFSATKNAFAGDPVTNEFLCEDGGGTWAGEGGSPWEGSCTYPPPSEFCDEGFSLIAYYDSQGELIDYDCIPSGSSSGSGGGEEYSHNSGQGGDAPIGLCTIAGGPWRCSFFAEGTCAQNCYIDPHLPAGANAALPGDAIATLYVNISPDPGGAYTVCFENPDNESLTIYQYLGGSWVALATSTNNPICASSSGDGSFYLGS